MRVRWLPGDIKPDFHLLRVDVADDAAGNGAGKSNEKER